MTGTVDVRIAEPAEWRSLREVRLASLRESPSAYVTTFVEAQAYPEVLWQERITENPHFLAYLDDTAVGIAVLIDSEPAPQLVAVWVRPDQRGLGVVDQLIGASVAHAQNRGDAELRLWVVTGNEAAERAYLRHGFRRTGRSHPVPGRIDDIEFEMSLALGGH